MIQFGAECFNINPNLACIGHGTHTPVAGVRQVKGRSISNADEGRFTRCTISKTQSFRIKVKVAGEDLAQTGMGNDKSMSFFRDAQTLSALPFFFVKEVFERGLTSERETPDVHRLCGQLWM